MKSQADIFWRHVEFEPNSGCWLWSGRIRTNNRGLSYGSVSVQGKKTGAHRYAYTAEIGPIPEGMVIDHLCRTPLCVNPAHLEPVTHQENVRRGIVGENNRSKTHCSRGHEYSGENLYLYRGGRYCRACWPTLKARRRQLRLLKASPEQSDV